MSCFSAKSSFCAKSKFGLCTKITSNNAGNFCSNIAVFDVILLKVSLISLSFRLHAFTSQLSVIAHSSEFFTLQL